MAALNKAQALDMLNRRVHPDGYQPERAAEEELLLRCMAYFAGKQHFWQNGSTLYDLAPENEHEVRYRANLLMPAVERMVATVMDVSGDFRVAPPDGSPRKRHAARLSDKVLQDIWDRADYADRKMELLKWAAICGSGFLKVEWNPRKGDADRFYHDKGGKTILPANDDERAQLERAGLFDDLAQGEVQYSPLGPFTVHWDWDSRGDVDDCLWMAENHLRSIPTVAEYYGLKEKDIPQIGDIPGSTSYDEALAFITSGTRNVVGHGYKPRQKEHVGRTLVTALYHRPTREYPKGLYIVRVGAQVLWVRDNPYRAIGVGLPYIKQDWNKMPGRFLGFGFVEQAISVQFQYNAARGKMAEFQNIMGQPPLMVPKNYGLPLDNLLLQPGVAYEVNTGAGQPFFLNPPQFPAEVAQNAGMAQAEINWMGSQTDPDATKAPGEMRSAPALNAWFREKNRGLSTPSKASLKTDKKAGRMTLQLARLNYTAARTIQVAGDGGYFEVYHFKGADLLHDVRVIGQAHTPDDIMGFKMEVHELVQAGALDPVNNRQHWRMLISAYRYHTFDEATQDWARDQRNQEREIEEMILDPAKWMEGGYPVAEFEDHEVHGETMARYMKGDDFRALDPAAQGLLYNHYQAHVQEVQKALEQQLAMAERMKGTPGEKGQPSAPKGRAPAQ